MNAPPPTALQRWIHRQWRILRVGMPILSALAPGFGIWMVVAQQPRQAIGVLISGAVIIGSFFSFRSTAGWVDDYDQSR